MTPGTGSLPRHADPPSYNGVGPSGAPVCLCFVSPSIWGPQGAPTGDSPEEVPEVPSSRCRSKPSRQFSLSSVPPQGSRAGFRPAVSPRPGAAEGRGWGVRCSRREGLAPTRRGRPRGEQWVRQEPPCSSDTWDASVCVAGWVAHGHNVWGWEDVEGPVPVRRDTEVRCKAVFTLGGHVFDVCPACDLRMSAQHPVMGVQRLAAVVPGPWLC